MNEFDKLVNRIAAAAPPTAEAEAAAARVREQLFGAVSEDVGAGGLLVGVVAQRAQHRAGVR